MTPNEIHNQDAGRIVADIIKPTLDAGGTMVEVLVLLESVIAGVMYIGVKVGCDEFVFDRMVENVKHRMAEMRLGHIPPAGSA
jgi:hypothetical protein